MNADPHPIQIRVTDHPLPSDPIVVLDGYTTARVTTLPSGVRYLLVRHYPVPLMPRWTFEIRSTG